MNKLAIVIAAAVGLALPGVANAATQCRNAQGHFIKCPTPAASPSPRATPSAHPTPHATATPHAAATPHASPSPRATGTTQRCRNAKGQFTRCGTPGSHPA